MAHIAETLKEEGNALFRSGDYSGAETKYTAAITRHPRNPLLFTNRAFARLKLQKWDGVVDDCLKSLEITGTTTTSSAGEKGGNGGGFNFKAWYYLAEAQLALHHPNEALASALRAYAQLMHPPRGAASEAAAAKAASSANLSAVSAFVLTCKKAKFAARERERMLRRGDILAELEEALEQRKRGALSEIEERLREGGMGVVEAAEQRQETLDAAQKKIEELRSVFAVADPKNHQPREVPDHLVDAITFEIMHDPVVTKTGHSYERATLLEHLKRSPTDPLTRERLTVNDLRPNIALRHTLEEFWKTAGNWAIEW
ncbi:hypothetical protein AAFC00_004632 [Neodothiora populina]|uniref:U-box domain-containing protein n=1 Tax=Neodothiora populina TaxID=2781224 RepID=A0ABR3P2Z8_9PEZI